MAVTHGLDPLVVRQIAKTIADAGHRLYDLGDEADRAVRALVWEGNDCAKFKAQWEGQGLRTFQEVAGRLEKASKDLGAQVDQQDATSNHGPSQPGGPGLPNPLDILGGLFGGDDDGGGLGGFLGDLAGGLWEGISGVGEAIGDGAEWVGDRLEDGAEWVGDRVEDGLSVAGHVFNWVGDRVTDGLGWAADAAEWGTDLLGSAVSGAGDLIGGALDWAGLDGAADFVRGGLNHLGGGIAGFGSALPRVVDNLSGLVHAIGDPMSEGRLPQIAEVGAAAFLLKGSYGGAFANLMAGRDLHLLDDGEGMAGEPRPVTGSQTTPTNVSTLVDGVVSAANDSTSSATNVRITTIPQPDGSNRYIVYTPGTQEWSPATAGQTPIDVTGNFVAMSGQRSAAMEGVQEAMAAVIPPGSDVMMVGHSQGAIINSQLVSDPAFMEQFHVTDMMAYGAPIDTADIPSGVNTLSLQHATDIVPRLDLAGADILGIPHPADQAANVTRVVLPSHGNAFEALNPGAQHDQGNYRDSIVHATGSDRVAIEAFQRDIAPYLMTQDDTVESVDVPVSRR